MTGIKQSLSLFHKFKSLTVVPLVILTLVFTMLLAGCSSSKVLLTYSNDFVGNLNKENVASSNFITDLQNADFQTDTGIYSFLKLIPNYLQEFNSFLISYQKEYPSNSPQDLKDAVNDAKEGTSNIIAGITMMNTALTNQSNEQLTAGENMVTDGFNLMDQSTTEYNSYADTTNANANSRNPNWFLGFVIGTGLVWFTIFVIITPLSKYVTKRRLANQTVNGYQFQLGQEVTQVVDKLATRDYILVGVVTFALIGFIVGRTTGMFFIGISWRRKDWPGMLSFIGFSLLGSYLY